MIEDCPRTLHHRLHFWMKYSVYGPLPIWKMVKFCPGRSASGW